MIHSIDVDTAKFIQLSMKKGFKINETLSNPDIVSKKLGLSLTGIQLQQLQSLNTIPERKELRNLSEDAKQFVSSVLKDGRYVLDWKEKPQEVSERLGLSLNPDIISELDNIDLTDYLDPDISPVAGVKIAIISVAIAVVLGSADIGDEQYPVLDLSKIEKL